MTIAAQDVYAAWFGIRTETRPLNPYALLGLADGESDYRRIRDAIERRRAQLQQRQPMADPRVWKSVQEELESAISLLEDTDEKRILDAALRRRRHKDSAIREFEPPAGLELTCVACSTPAPSGRRFCGRCGEPLWSICFECGQPSPACEPFCAACGADRQSSTQQAIVRFEELLSDARSKRQQGNWPEAMERACELACYDDPRVDHLVEQAIELWRQVKVEYQQAQERAARVEQHVLERVAAGDEDQARGLIESIPAALRSEKVRALYDRMLSADQEWNSLQQELRRYREQQRVADVRRVVDRMLSLRPNDERALKLAAQLAAHAFKTTERFLREGNTSKARHALELVPATHRGNAYLRLEARVSELEWLANHLRRADEADTTLIHIAQRLSRLIPNRQDLAQQVARIRLAASHPPDQRQVPWRRRPHRSAIGPPIDDWRRARRIAVGPSLTGNNGSDMRDLVIALGLALQGLERVPVSTNLVTVNRGLLSKLASRRKKPTASWGIDVGTHELKAVLLRLGPREQPVLERIVRIPIDGRVASKGEAEWSAYTAPLQSLAAQIDAEIAQPICISLPARWLVLKSVAIPYLQGKQVNERIAQEAKYQFPLPLDELAWSYFLHELPDEPAAQPRLTPVTFFAARKTYSEGFLNLCKSAGIQDAVLQSGAIAAVNLFAYENAVELPYDQAPRLDDTRKFVIVDIGYSATNFVALVRGHIWSRSIPISSRSLTECLIREFRWTSDQAQAFQREPHRAPKIHRFYQSMEPVIAGWLAEVRRTLQAVADEHANWQPDAAYLIGGGSMLSGWSRYMWHDVKGMVK